MSIGGGGWSGTFSKVVAGNYMAHPFSPAQNVLTHPLALAENKMTHPQKKISDFIVLQLYIPLISRVRGPYGKLWTEFFPSFYGPSAKRAGHENKEGKNEDP